MYSLDLLMLVLTFSIVFMRSMILWFYFSSTPMTSWYSFSLYLSCSSLSPTEVPSINNMAKFITEWAEGTLLLWMNFSLDLALSYHVEEASLNFVCGVKQPHCIRYFTNEYKDNLLTCIWEWDRSDWDHWSFSFQTASEVTAPGPSYYLSQTHWSS